MENKRLQAQNSDGSWRDLKSGDMIECFTPTRVIEERAGGYSVAYYEKGRELYSCYAVILPICARITWLSDEYFGTASGQRERAMERIDKIINALCIYDNAQKEKAFDDD